MSRILREQAAGGTASDHEDPNSSAEQNQVFPYLLKLAASRP